MGVHSKKINASAELSLRESITRNQGWMPFEDLMAFALYDPDFGYYTSRIREVGRTGDFSTSAHKNSLLGQAIAVWAMNRKERLGIPWHKRWHLIEMGGGNGTLAETVLQRLGCFQRLGLTYHLVEISQPLESLQRKRLRRYDVHWHRTIEEALLAASGVALIFSNELVDAFPCRRFSRTKNGWAEMGVVIQEGKIVESSREMSGEDLAKISSSALAEPVNGRQQIVEVHESYRTELINISQHLRTGSLLTIDYGDHFPEVYHRQPGGTLRGYFHHLRIDASELYTRLGQQDLTADVNFTDLENWGQALSFQNDSLMTQRDFIQQWLGAITPKNTDEARLLDGNGAGGAFKVLEQTQVE